MAYSIQKTDGEQLTVINDGTVDTTTNLTLIGKNYAGYGDFLNENLVRLLENASNINPPPNPLRGQLWWDKANSLLKVYTGAAFKTVSSSTAAATAPGNAVTGDLWWDSTNGQLNVYNGSSFTLIGPAFTTGTGTSGTQVETIYDTSTPPVGHVAVKVYVQNTPVAIISKSASYSPNPGINGYGLIKPGFNLIAPGVVPGIAYNGVAEDSSKLGNIAATNYARTDVSSTFTSTITVRNNTGITIGSDSNTLSTYISSGAAVIENKNLNGNFTLKANVGGTITNVIHVNGTTGRAEVTGDPTTPLGIATMAFVESKTSGNLDALLRDGSRTIRGSLLPDVTLGNGTINLGSSAAKFGDIHAKYLIGTSVQAQYADLAERFHSDAEYTPGTVVALGGTAEITAAAEELSESVFGVISTKAAYLMNAMAGSDATHPAVAVNGRVPVRVVGKINKGDRLVAAGNGLARAGARNEISSFNVIGRALETKTTDGEDTILAIVKLNS